MKRYNVLTLLIVFTGYLSGYATTPENSDNIVIDDEIHTYTIIEKNGEMASVKCVEETTYTALRTDGYADAVAFYNDNITIDKASAPGAKPYYRSWQSSDVFYDGSRICYLHVPVKKDKNAKVSFQQTYKAPEHFCNINLASPYKINKGTATIKVPTPLASRIKVEPYCLPENIVLSRTAMPDGSMEYIATISDLPAWKPQKGAPSASVSAPQLIVTGIFPDVKALYRHFRKFTEGSDKGSPEIDRLAAELVAKASTPLAMADSIATWVRRNIRYLAVEHGEYAFRPESAPDVLKNRAGDCKGSANLSDKESTASDYWLALIFCDILRKEKLAEEVGVAFINPSTDVPTGEILNWRQPDFGALVDGRLYLVGSIESFLPGELPAEYQGQMCASYTDDRKKLWDYTTPTVITTPISKSGENRITINSVITLGDDHDATVTNEITCTGATKDLFEGFISADEWFGLQAAYLGVDNAPKVILKNDNVEKRRLEQTEDFYSSIFIGSDPEVSNVNVASFGITPELPDFRIMFDSKVKEISTDAGDEIIVKIGQFAGDNKRIEGKQRERMTDISFKGACQENYSLTLNIPERYEVEDASLLSLTKNVQTPVGMFITGAKKSDDGRSVTVAARSRISHPTISIAGWPHVLDLTDAKADFADAVIILKKK